MDSKMRNLLSINDVLRHKLKSMGTEIYEKNSKLNKMGIKYSDLLRRASVTEISYHCIKDVWTLLTEGMNSMLNSMETIENTKELNNSTATSTATSTSTSTSTSTGTAVAAATSASNDTSTGRSSAISTTAASASTSYTNETKQKKNEITIPETIDFINQYTKLVQNHTNEIISETCNTSEWYNHNEIEHPNLYEKILSDNEIETKIKGTFETQYNKSIELLSTLSKKIDKMNQISSETIVETFEKENIKLNEKLICTNRDIEMYQKQIFSLKRDFTRTEYERHAAVRELAKINVDKDNTFKIENTNSTSTPNNNNNNEDDKMDDSVNTDTNTNENISEYKNEKEKEIAYLKGTLTRIENDYLLAQNENAQLKTLIEVYTEKESPLRQEVEHEKKRRKQVEDDLFQLIEEKNQIEKKNKENMDKLMKEIKDTNEKFIEKNKKLTEEAQKTLMRYETEHNKIQNLKVKLEKAQMYKNQRHECMVQLKVVEANLQVANTQVDKLKEDIENLQKKYDDEELEKKKLLLKIGYLESDKTKLEKEIEDLKNLTSIKKCETCDISLEDTMNKRQNDKIEELQKELADCKSHFYIIQDENIKRRDELREFVQKKYRYDQYVTHLKSQCDKAVKENKKFIKLNSLKEKAEQTLNKKLCEFTALKKNYQEEIVNLHERDALQKSCIQALEERVVHNDMMIKNKELEIIEKRREINDIRNKNDEISRDYRFYKNEFGKMEHLFGKYRDLVATVRAEGNAYAEELNKKNIDAAFEEEKRKKEIQEKNKNNNNKKRKINHQEINERNSIENFELKTLRTLVTCSVCEEKQKNAIITKCYHMFCNDCLQSNVRSRNRKCPTCKKMFGQDDIHAVWID